LPSNAVKNWVEDKMKMKTLIAAGAVASMSLASAVNANVIDLAFIMDESGSVGSSNYGAAMDSLASALESSLANSPTDTYNVTVISFAASASVVASATIAPNTSSANIKTVLGDGIRGDAHTGGLTCYSCAFGLLSDSSGDFGIINMMTDGDPTAGDTSTSGLLADVADLRDNGNWDSLSFEAVGTGASDSLLQALAFDTAGTGPQLALTDPNDITDPLNESFVLAVSDFGTAYDAAISTKVQRIVDPGPAPIPLPAAAWMLLAGIGALFGLRRRAA
jgi:hypothetical protein